MRTWIIRLWIICSLGLILTACQGLPSLPFGSTDTPPPPTATEEPTPIPTAVITPTQPPDMALWPLVADLYYLRDGRIWRQPAAGDDSTAEAITNTDVTVVDFDIAPGDDWLGYITQTGSVVITATDLSRSTLVSEQGAAPQVSDTRHTIAWSPDGRRLAYVSTGGFQAYYPGSGINAAPLVFDLPETEIVDLQWEKNGEWLYVQRADTTAALYQADPVLSLFAELGPVQDAEWLEDGRLAFSPFDGGLAILQPENLAAREFIVPQGRIVTRIHQRSDDLLAFFIHEVDANSAGFLHTANPSDLSFSPESAVGVLTTTMVWNPAGTRMIEKEQQTVRLLDPNTGSRTEFTTRSRVDLLRWGSLLPETVRAIDLPNTLYYLAPQSGVVQVWRLPADRATPEAITQADADVTDFTISDDGTQIAYTSAGSIYRVVIGITQDAPIVELEGEGGQPDFNASGTRLAYSDEGIWFADLTEAEPTTRRIIDSQRPQGFGQDRLVEAYSNPRWSPNGDFILADVEFFEGTSLAVLPITNRQRAIPSQLDLFGHQGEWLLDGRILAYSDGQLYNNAGMQIIESTAAYEEDDEPIFTPEAAQIITTPAEQALITDAGRVFLLRNLAASAVGPNSLTVLSTDEAGTDFRVESDSLVLERPTLSPDGSTLAGLVDTTLNQNGDLVGRLLINDLQTGESVIIDGAVNVRSLQWGQGN